MEALKQDLTFAVRSLGKNPAFTVTVVIVLAFSIGVNTTIFSIVSAVLIRPLPYEDPDRFVMIRETDLKEVADPGGPSRRKTNSPVMTT